MNISNQYFVYLQALACFSYKFFSCEKYLLQILDEMPVFYNLNVIEKREVLVVILQIIRNLDDTTLVKAWQQSIARTRLFFKLLEECITHFEVCTITLGSLECCSICQYYQLL
jgi:hypothetical protein